MQHVHSFRELRQIENAIFAFLLNPYLAHTETHRWHGFPVFRINPVLYAIELMSGVVPRFLWEFANAPQTVAAPSDELHGEFIPVLR
jgi:hypothetical protein